jgi:Zn-dependent M28 family amino/carboxypeptidase
MIRRPPTRRVSSLIPLAALLAAASCGPAEDGVVDREGAALTDDRADVAAEAPLDASDIARHTRTLSADSFGGRAPGTPGGEMAAAYIADAFRSAGLEPVDGSWLQAVPMVGSTPRRASASLSFAAGGSTFGGAYLDDFVAWGGDAEAERSSSKGELVFVGYGIVAPEADWNDFEGVDVRGKVLLGLVNDPPAPAEEPELFGGRAMTYYGRWTYKFEEAARQGAAGALLVHVTDMAGYGWNVVESSWSGEQFSLPADSEAPAPAAVQGWITRELATEVLAAAGLELDELIEQASRRDFQAVPTGIQVEAALESDVRTVETHNVVGLVPGTARPDEVITVTSHYDHLGTGQPVDGDSIYNGAYDNASGTALLIEMAETFAARDPRPERSLLFIATAAEEQGLLGASWYVQAPLVPLERTVAEVNVDGANLWGETDDVTVMGADRSELRRWVEPRAAQLGLRMAPDAEPEKGFFFRSDHFPFAKAGVPSLYVEHGRAYRGRPQGWGDSIQADYTASAYHAPADEWSDEFVFEGAVQQGRLAYLVILDLANDDAWPNWLEGSEFRAARDRMMGSAGGG